MEGGEGPTGPEGGAVEEVEEVAMIGCGEGCGVVCDLWFYVGGIPWEGGRKDERGGKRAQFWWGLAGSNVRTVVTRRAVVAG